MPGRRYDAAHRRRATRSGRQTGCFIYIPGEVLEALGIEPGGKLPWYRVFLGARKAVMVNLYPTV